ncbi:MAG TPA: Ig-like domain-containing protein [Tepidisphaeraceae bacterium]|nr:Ig-like domain-containing protein [Tepidisphaeraceae bacterium]
MLETVERRRLLSVAPDAADDGYELGPDHRLSVDVPAGPIPAFDQARFIQPAGHPETPTSVRTIEGGRVVMEPAWVELGEERGSFDQLVVRDFGSRWVVSDWLEVAERGRASISVTNGGAVNVRNWTAIGANTASAADGGGIGEVTVSGPTSRWISLNHMTVGYGNSWGTVRLLDGAQMTVNGSPPNPSSGFISVGDRGTASGLIEVLGGSALRHNDWLEVGNNDARGEVRVAEGGLLATANFASIGNNRGQGAVTVSGAGSRWTVGNHLSVGDNGGRGVLRIEDGASVTTGNWMEIGRYANSDGRVIVGDGSTLTYTDSMSIGGGVLDSTRGTLYVAEGGRVVGTGSQGFGDGPYITNQTAGRILGEGSIQAWIYNGGFVSPGGSIGTLTIQGGFFQPGPGLWPVAPTGVLQFDIGGTARGSEHDALNVSGEVRLQGGKVVLNFVNGFAPKAGDRFELIDAGTLNSSPDPRMVEVRGLAPGFQYSLGFEGDRLVLVAKNDATSAPQQVQRKGVLANDTDGDGDALTAVLTKRPQHGTVTLYRDGSFSYVPGPTFTGTDSFEYVADDGAFTSDSATVTIRNLPPVARDDAYATDEDTPLTVARQAGVLANDADSVTPTLFASLDQGPRHGTLTLNADGSFSYTPNANFSGTDSFSYRASDGQLSSEPATVTLTVRAANDAPIAGVDTATVRQGGTLSLSASSLLANDTDPDGDTLQITGVFSTADTHGRVSLAGGRVVYTPDRNYSGPASFSYTVSDGNGGTATGTVRVTVLPPVRGNAGHAAGRGSLDGGRRTFSFAVVAREGDPGLNIKGMLLYQDRQRRLTFRATDFDLFEISRSGREVKIAGTAVVNDQAGYRFEVTAEDKSSSGSNDRFRIVITGPQGSNFRYDSSDAGRNGTRIDRGGNIMINPADDDED